MQIIKTEGKGGRVRREASTSGIIRMEEGDLEGGRKWVSEAPLPRMEHTHRHTHMHAQSQRLGDSLEAGRGRREG